MIAVKHITFKRAEGAASECTTHAFVSFEVVDAHVREAARSAPDDGSYHKCDVTVAWLDGVTWSFRFDMTYSHHAMVHPLTNDFRLDLAWHTGIMAAADGADTATYARKLREFDETYPGARERALTILGEYALGGAA